jgi:small subunit ribosomal protein S1
MHEDGGRIENDGSKAVVDNMEMTADAQTEEAKDQSFQDLFEQTFNTIQEGEVLRGRVVVIGKEFVMVDVGYKSEGQIPIHEFQDENGELSVQEGDRIEVLLESRDDEDGQIVLSKAKADKLKIWEEIRGAYEQGGTVRGRIMDRVKGGLSVDIGVSAFLPGSQVDLRPVRNLDRLIGQMYEFRVLKYNRRRSNIVLSRRALLEEQRSAAREKTLASLEEGMTIRGVVKNITDYGAFIDLGGVDGLLHITDMSWGRIKHPTEVLQIGEEREVMVLQFDRDRERVSLGLKQLTSDPWSNVEEKHPVGTRLEGRVVSIAEYGAFVEIEKGVEGLVHVSEMSWTRKIRHPSKVVNIGDVVEVVVLNVDQGRKRISLGMKQVKPNPWVTVAETYPVGTIIQGKIRNITDFGLFIGLDEGIDGMVHVSDISWTKRVRHPGEIYKKGEEIKAIVLHIDQENERFSLGIKQLQPDPWESLHEKYPVGSKVSGRVTSVTDFGVFLEIEEGIEGLIHVSELRKEKVKSASEVCTEGDDLEAAVIHLDPKERKIGLSVKDLQRMNEEADIQGYLGNQSRYTPTIGAILRDELLKKAKETQEASEKQEEKADSAPTEAEEKEKVSAAEKKASSKD